MEDRLLIEQKKGRHLRRYQILGEAIKAELKTESSYQSFTIKFDEIDFDELVIDRKPNVVEIGLFLSVFFNILLSIILFSEWLQKMQIGTIVMSTASMAIVSGMSGWAYFLFRFQREKILKGTKNIFLFYGNKDREIVDGFIDTLKRKQSEYFRNLYIPLDETIDLQTYEFRLKWLLDKKHINKEEYKKLQEGIDRKKIIGF